MPPAGISAALCSKPTNKRESFAHVIWEFLGMLDKTIDSALQQLHRQALNGKGGLDPILALMALRGLEPVAKRL